MALQIETLNWCIDKEFGIVDLLSFEGRGPIGIAFLDGSPVDSQYDVDRLTVRQVHAITLAVRRRGNDGCMFMVLVDRERRLGAALVLPEDGPLIGPRSLAILRFGEIQRIKMLTAIALGDGLKAYQVYRPLNGLWDIDS